MIEASGSREAWHVLLGPSLAAAMLDELFEHPVDYCPIVPDGHAIEILTCLSSFILRPAKPPIR